MAGKKGGATAYVAPKKTDLAIKVRIDKLFDDPQNKLKAIASANIGDFAVHGIRVYENEKGLFAAMPSTSYTDAQGNKQYEDIFHPVTSDARKELFDSVRESYEQALAQQQNAGESHAPAPEQVQKM